MTILQLFTSTAGRISRQTWWFGAAGLAVVYLIVTRLLGLILQYERVSPDPSDVATFRMEYTWATTESLWWHSMASLAWSVVFSALAWGLCVKRRHDRASNGWDVAIVLVVPILLSLIGLVQSLLPVAPSSGPDAYALGVFLLTGYIYSPFALYVLVVLGLLKGTAGPNRYGSDPLASAPPTNPQEPP